MSKVLITGADGFIGSHLVENLVRQGHDVKAFVFYNSFNSWGWLDRCSADIKNNFEIFSGDIRDPYGVKESMHGCDRVIHLAALIAIPYSYHSPHSYIETNITGTLNILQAAKERNLNRIIHTSTSEVYGTAKYVPIDEKHPLVGQSPYSASKIAADQLVNSFYSSFDLPVVTLRPFNTYGPRQSARAVIPTIISQVLNDKKILKLGSITPTRDFSYIDDTVNGFISVLNSSYGVGDTFNLGSGFEVSIKKTAEIICSLMRSELKISSDNERVRPKNSEVERLCSKNSKVKKVFNWKPKYNSIDGFKIGIEKTINWFSEVENFKSYKSEIYNK